MFARKIENKLHDFCTSDWGEYISYRKIIMKLGEISCFLIIMLSICSCAGTGGFKEVEFKDETYKDIKIYGMLIKILPVKTLVVSDLYSKIGAINGRQLKISEFHSLKTVQKNISKPSIQGDYNYGEKPFFSNNISRTQILHSYNRR